LVTHRLNLLEVVFEVASAMGTVGLSLGVTRELTEVGKIIIILCMFLGRIGPASLLIIMIKREKTQVVSYPEEKILLG
jgi:trk system potassium uptake protein TrkH